MAYIDRNGKKYKYNSRCFKKLNYGECANVFYDKNKNIIFKIYDEDLENKYRIKSEIFDILKQIKSPYFMELYNLYMQVKLKERIEYNLKKDNFRVDCYTAKYYKKIDIDPIFTDKEYLLSSLKGIEKVFDILSTYRIEVSDIKMQNSVYTKDGIVIIDPDFYFFSIDPESEIKKMNKKAILSLLKSILLWSKIPYNETRELRSKLNIVPNENKSITDEIAKELKYVKKPIDIIRK